MIEAINCSQQVPTNTTGTSAPLHTSQQQSLQAQIKTLTQKLNELTPANAKPNKVAAYSGSQENYQDKFAELMERIKHMQSQIVSLDRWVDARINGLAQCGQEARTDPERSRDGRPICFSCGMGGHYQNSCSQQSSCERQPVPRYALPAPDNMWSNGPQSRSRTLPPPRQPNRVTAFDHDINPLSGHGLNTTIPHSQFEECESEPVDHECLGDWDYYRDYEPRHEGYDCLDNFDLVPGEGDTMPESFVSTMTASTEVSPTTDQFLLPCDQFPQPWLTMLPTDKAEQLSTDFKANPEVPISDQILTNSYNDCPLQEDAADPLDLDMYYLPPLTDEEYQSGGESESEDIFDLPVPVPYPLCPTTDRPNLTADTGDLRYHDTDAQTTPPVMVDTLLPEDVKPPPYPGIGDVCSPDVLDPFELQEIIVERPSP